MWIASARTCTSARSCAVMGRQGMRGLFFLLGDAGDGLCYRFGLGALAGSRRCHPHDHEALLLGSNDAYVPGRLVLVLRRAGFVELARRHGDDFELTPHRRAIRHGKEHAARLLMEG